MDNPPQSPVESATSYVEAIIAGNTEAMSAMMKDDFVWRLLPATLGVPKKNKRQYLLQSVDLGQIFVYLKVNMRSPLEVIEAGATVVVHVTSEGRLAAGTAYENECIMIFHCEDGKVRSMMEFMDSENMRRPLEADSDAGYKLLRRTYGEDD
ncbi:hypothetical protein C8R47DRAFT_1212648 [Mycena vitilis]|nr:hypothetical protein C8R47DRAFT_1212648 [Mycena vitilis]